MTVVVSLLTQMIHIGLIIAAAPTVAGLMDWLDARFAGRAGPPVLQPWRDLVRLSRKTPVVVESVSMVSHHAQAACLAATLSAAALVPSFTLGMVLSPLADILVIVSFLTMARVAAAMVGFDAGAALPGLRQQAVSALAVIAEPALMLAIATPALMSGSLNLDVIISQQREGMLLPATASALAVTALLALAFADIAGAADHGANQTQDGVDLAVSWMATWIRRLIWINLISNVFLPLGIAGMDSGPLAWLTGLAVWCSSSAPLPSSHPLFVPASAAWHPKVCGT